MAETLADLFESGDDLPRQIRHIDRANTRHRSVPCEDELRQKPPETFQSERGKPIVTNVIANFG